MEQPLATIPGILAGFGLLSIGAGSIFMGSEALIISGLAMSGTAWLVRNTVSSAANLAPSKRTVRPIQAQTISATR
ncbi:MAG TPA: hypothetical protein VKG44_07735 [Candidatus Baltobacteraceae bacterium]|nr:hypothetical protein [Candidatus Baltobacteraceae bacterium]